MLANSGAGSFIPVSRFGQQLGLPIKSGEWQQQWTTTVATASSFKRQRPELISAHLLEQQRTAASPPTIAAGNDEQGRSEIMAAFPLLVRGQQRIVGMADVTIDNGGQLCKIIQPKSAATHTNEQQ
ncbi:hypothetical protein ACLOJK_037175 [Asimina triloba]